MKKVLLLSIVLFLAACERPTLDIRQELLTTLKAQRSFAVEETFVWNRFASLNNAPWNAFIEINNTIEFENNRYFVVHSLDEETNTNRVIDRTLFEAASYKNIYSRNAAIRIDQRWYNIDLPLINAIGLGSFDPVLVVSELLFNNIELYYKTDTGVTGDIASYRIAVVTISDTLFERLFEHSAAPYVDVPYAYNVTAEIRFNDAYEVTDIVFDLSRLIRQYRDYYIVQQGAVFNSLSGQFSLSYSAYDAVNVSQLPLGMSLQPSTTSLTIESEALTSSTLVQPTFTTLIDPNSGEREVLVTVAFDQIGRLALVELLGVKDGNQVVFEQRQVVPVGPDNNVVFKSIANANNLDALYVSVRYLERQSATVIFETLDLTTGLKAYLTN